MTIQVTSVNDPPVANDDEMFVRQATPIVYDLLANDVDVDGTLNRQSIVIVQNPKSGDIAFLPDGTIRFTPDMNFLGIDTFEYTVRDNSGATSNAAIVTVTVSGDNFAPVAQDDEATTGVGQAVVINLVANDSDPDDSIVPDR